MTNKLLNTGALLFFALMMTALLISKLSTGKYSKSNERVFELSLQDDFMMDYLELLSHQQSPSGHIMFVDLRDPDLFARGHIPGAISVPRNELFDKTHRKVFKDAVTKVLYSGEEKHTIHAALMLLGEGYTNIRVLPGSFDIIEAHILTEEPDPAYYFHRDDKARFDYPRFMGSGSRPAAAEADQPVPSVPQIRTEMISVQGGC